MATSLKRANAARHGEGAALAEVDRDAGLLCRLAGGVQHPRFGIYGGDPHPGLREENRQRAGAAAEVHHRVAGLETHDLDNPVDQFAGIGQPVARVERHGRAETAWFVCFRGRDQVGHGFGFDLDIFSLY